jgi:hypothetical protein
LHTVKREVQSSYNLQKVNTKYFHTKITLALLAN